MNPQEKVDGVISAVQSYVPGFSTKRKSESWSQRVLGKIFAKLGNNQYMNLYWTTIGKIVYRPTLCDNKNFSYEWQVLLHEGRHVNDCYKMGLPLYSFLYLFPQVIGALGFLYALALIPALLLGGPIVLLWGLLSLLCLAPLPALPRALIEVRGYTVSLACDFWCGLIPDEERYMGQLVDRFVKGDYYYMWPFKGMVRKYFNKKLDALKTNTLELDSYLVVCKTKCSMYR